MNEDAPGFMPDYNAPITFGEQFRALQNLGSQTVEFVNGVVRIVPAALTQLRQTVQKEARRQPQIARPTVQDNVVTASAKTTLGFAEGYEQTESQVMDLAATGVERVGKFFGVDVPAPVSGAVALLVGAVLPGPGEFKPTIKAGKAMFRPNVTGMRNADARAVLGDYVTDPAVAAARPGSRLESEPIYKLLQKGRAPKPGETMSSMPMFMSPHHRVDVKGSIPFFEGSTEAANIQRRADLAVGDIYPGNHPLNYTGLWDGPLSGKASKKTGVYSTDHQDVHKAMEDLRRKFGLKAKGGTDAVADLPDDIKTGLLADLSMRDELAINKVLSTRMDMVHEAFPDMSYDEIKDIILNNPKRFANLSRTSEGYLYSLIAPE